MSGTKSEINGKHILAVIDQGFTKEWFEIFFGRDGAYVDVLYDHNVASEAISKTRYDAVITDFCLWENCPQPQAKRFITKCVEKGLPLVVLSAAEWENQIPQFERLVFLQTTEICGHQYDAMKKSVLKAMEKAKKTGKQGDDLEKLLSYDWHMLTPTEKWLRRLSEEEGTLQRIKIGLRKELETAAAAPYETSKREMDAMMREYLTVRRMIEELHERRANPRKTRRPKQILKQ